MGRRVHFGLPKSGSTAIQRFLSANRNVLRDFGLTWCESLRGPNHVQLAVAGSTQINHVAGMVGVHNERDRAALRSRVVKRLEQELSDHETVLVVHRAPRVPRSPHPTTSDGSRRCSKVWPTRSCWSVSFAGATTGCRAPTPRQLLNNKDLASTPTSCSCVAPMLDHLEFVARWQGAFGDRRGTPGADARDRQGRPGAVPFRARALGVAETPTIWQSPPRITHPTLSAHGTELLRAVTPWLPRWWFAAGAVPAEGPGFHRCAFPGAGGR